MASAFPMERPCTTLEADPMSNGSWGRKRPEGAWPGEREPVFRCLLCWVSGNFRDVGDAG